jgi:hypothetical protein
MRLRTLRNPDQRKPSRGKHHCKNCMPSGSLINEMLLFLQVAGRKPYIKPLLRKYMCSYVLRDDLA